MVMINSLSQGDIIILEDAKNPLLVVSKDFFNEAGQIIACPIVNKETLSPYHVNLETDKISGEIFCEQIRHLDVKQRRYRRVGAVNICTMMTVSDILQSLVDYI